MKRSLLTCLLLLQAPLASAGDQPATLAWSQRVDIAVPVTGVVEAVLVQPGQSVRRGAPLLRLNERVFEAAVLEAKADAERYAEEAAEAARDLERARELFARTVSSTTEFDLAKLRKTRADAGLATAQARVERARRLLDESAPRAPFEALVLARHAEPGMATSQCQPAPLLTLARSDEILARAEVAPGTVAALAPGSVIPVNVAGSEIAGQLRALVPTDAGLYRIEVAMARTPELIAGLPATLRLP